MREIKFRARHKNTGTWYSGTSEPKSHLDYRNLEHFFGLIISNVLDQETLCQFTGLLDKNGKEIYEGDIVDVGSGGCEVFYNDEFSAYWVKHEKDEFYSSLIDFLADDYGEVIGNIYENPALLRKEK
jgi:uncharacterized phage protein (TIGR01671 family)